MQPVSFVHLSRIIPALSLGGQSSYSQYLGMAHVFSLSIHLTTFLQNGYDIRIFPAFAVLVSIKYFFVSVIHPPQYFSMHCWSLKSSMIFILTSNIIQRKIKHAIYNLKELTIETMYSKMYSVWRVHSRLSIHICWTISKIQRKLSLKKNEQLPYSDITLVPLNMPAKPKLLSFQIIISYAHTKERLF